jgi:protease I
VDIYNLYIQFTDPVTTALLREIEKDLSLYERHLATLYRARMGNATMPAKPTTGAAVAM